MAATMGRRPSKNLNLPPKMRARPKAGGILWYYYDAGGKPRKEIPLGCDYTAAVRKWAELEQDKPEKAAQLLTFKNVADRYIRDVLPTKAARTQRDNLIELEWLFKFFNAPPAPLDSIKPGHIRQYMDLRGKTGKIRANREKALFSHIWNMARSWGLTDKPNPCAGIKGFSEVGRDIYIEDAVLEAVWEAADITLRDALDLAYLTGQRPADALSMRETDIRDGMLVVEQNKTGKKLRIELVGELADLVARIKKRKESYKIHTLALICTEAGRALTEGALRSRFDKARTAAVKTKPELAEAIKAFQFRDLRAKAGTDKADTDGMRAAQEQLGHENMAMTEHYVRSRKGQKVSPTR
ncbi:MAG: tyrosine-type recombinase/integrase [Sideroxydans sp.]|nr:tyrosine-type recombinase/integrase [Sideroxydans sp.]MDD5056692.1 tyrosine-type recombinase/integrase [Sideroxydans sp.]